PSGYRCDKDGVRRIVAPVPTFAGFVDAALNQIRQFGADSVSVTLRLREIIASAAQQLINDEQRSVLLHHAEMAYRQGRNKYREPSDLDDLETRYHRAIDALHRAGARAT
ncbi:MAG: DUF2254 family protein, partial [Steroidobacteraceae bacterium]